jgi:hypothetical protein
VTCAGRAVPSGGPSGIGVGVGSTASGDAAGEASGLATGLATGEPAGGVPSCAIAIWPNRMATIASVLMKASHRGECMVTRLPCVTGPMPPIEFSRPRWRRPNRAGAVRVVLCWPDSTTDVMRSRHDGGTARYANSGFLRINGGNRSFGPRLRYERPTARCTDTLSAFVKIVYTQIVPQPNIPVPIWFGFPTVIQAGPPDRIHSRRRSRHKE